jgi:hypothetical protein
MNTSGFTRFFLNTTQKQMSLVTNNNIPLDMMFEPTGILLKDYNAYCEVDGLLERDDLIDAVSYAEFSDPVSGTKKLRTRLTLRNPPRNNLLPRRDFLPMAKAIPHCNSLDIVQLTGCGVTDVCIKNLAEAVYRSPSITSVTVDFNCSAGLASEPRSHHLTHNADGEEEVAVPSNEIFVTALQFRSGALNGLEDNTLSGTTGNKKDDKRKNQSSHAMPTGAKAKAAAAREAEEQERMSQQIPIPDGWAALCFNGIQHLCLRGNKISDADVLTMAAHIEEPYSDLRALNLWGNEITDVGAQALAKAISQSRRLTALDLGQNKLGDAAAEAFANIFLTVDVTVEEAQRLRTRTLTVLNTSTPVAPLTPPVYEPLPLIPTFQEIFHANGDDGVDAGASGSSPDKSMRGSGAAAKSMRASSRAVIGRETSGLRGNSGAGSRSKGETFAMNDRPKTDFDRDLVRLEDGRIRVPGCIQITTLSLSHNPLITDRGVLAMERVLKTQEPTRSEECQMNSAGIPTPYCSTLSLKRLEIGNTNVSDSVMNKLAVAMQKVITRKQVTQ